MKLITDDTDLKNLEVGRFYMVVFRKAKYYMKVLDTGISPYEYSCRCYLTINNGVQKVGDSNDGHPWVVFSRHGGSGAILEVYELTDHEIKMDILCEII